MSTLPLQGIKVLDLSKVLAGPLCAQYLGDMGADVVKIESPGGDETRQWPPFRDNAESGPTGAVYLSANRNKRSLVVDLRQPGGQEVVHTLAAQADVVIESFGPGVAARLGVNAASLRARNPRLVCCNISGYGNVGPMRQGKGYDVILQAFTGMLAISGEPGGPPIRAPYSPVDQATGMHALIGILAALLERGRTGEGQVVEASLFDTATGFLGYFLQSYWERGTEPERPGSGHESLCPYQAFETADAPMVLGVANDTLWRAFCALAGLEAMASDPRFSTNAARVQQRADVVGRVQAALRTRTRDDWLTRLHAAGIPCSPVHTLGELAAHPHTRASGMITDYQHPSYGRMQAVSQPLRFAGERTALRRAPPACGEQGGDILREAGYDDARIQALASQGAVVLPARPTSSTPGDAACAP